MAIENYLALAEVEKQFEWRKWMEEIPYLRWPSDWLVKAVPPWSTGIIRYFITKEGLNDRVSVYLDCYDMAGYMKQPYWEIYPHDGDCARCYMNETDELLKLIGEALAQLEARRQ